MISSMHCTAALLHCQCKDILSPFGSSEIIISVVGSNSLNPSPSTNLPITAPRLEINVYPNPDPSVVGLWFANDLEGCVGTSG